MKKNYIFLVILIIFTLILSNIGTAINIIDNNIGKRSSDDGITYKITEPHLAYTSSLSFGIMEPNQIDSKTFDIWNSGTGTLIWSVSESCSWITSILPNNGDCTVEHDSITVNINTAGLSDGHYGYNISISSNDVGGTVTISLDVSTSTSENIPGFQLLFIIIAIISLISVFLTKSMINPKYKK